MSRASTSYDTRSKKDVDARDKPGHDHGCPLNVKRLADIGLSTHCESMGATSCESILSRSIRRSAAAAGDSVLAARVAGR